MKTDKLYIAKIKREEFLIRDEWDEKFLSYILARIKKLKLNITEKDRWLDIGGFIGGFIVSIGSKVDHIYSFEADKDNAEVLKANKDYHFLDNVDLYTMAVIGTNSATKSFYLNPLKNKSLHSFSIKNRRRSVVVNCLSINNLIEKINVDKILIDACGSEYDIINHISRENFHKIKEIGIVYYPYFYREKNNHPTYNKIVDILKDFYNIVEYNEKALGEDYLLIHALNNKLSE